MPYDPTKPADSAKVDAPELRAQFAALKAINDAQQVQINQLLAQVADLAQQVSSLPTPAIMESEIVNHSAANVNAVQPLATPSYPPTQSDVLGIVGKINELIGGLHR